MCVPACILITELEIRQKREQIPAGTLLLAVEDPQTRVGSGGATLNALLVAAEHLSARAGFTVSAPEPPALWPVLLLELSSFWDLQLFWVQHLACDLESVSLQTHLCHAIQGRAKGRASFWSVFRKKEPEDRYGNTEKAVAGDYHKLKAHLGYVVK